MKLTHIPGKMVDLAWAQGANSLEEACHEECSIDQLKMLIARDEKLLVRMDDEDKAVGWCVCYAVNLPNYRILHVSHLVAHNAQFEKFYELLKGVAVNMGCSRMRCCAQPAQSRLYQMKIGFKPVYETLEIKLI